MVLVLLPFLSPLLVKLTCSVFNISLHKVIAKVFLLFLFNLNFMKGENKKNKANFHHSKWLRKQGCFFVCLFLKLSRMHQCSLFDIAK